MKTEHGKIEINCDMGESFGIYKMGNDVELMPYVTQANVACGFHASDPDHMRKTVKLAKKHNVKVGAHVSLPDLNGFGRREMKMEAEELENLILYQTGALKAFLDLEKIELKHLKPHGALYGMTASNSELAESAARVAKEYDVPLLGLGGTEHEKACKKLGVPFVSEFFADLDYDSEGKIIITRQRSEIDPDLVVERGLRIVEDGKILCQTGKLISYVAESICIHSDTPNSPEIARRLNEALKNYLSANE